MVHPQVENYWGNVNPIGVRACYNEGKRVAETLCVEYQSVYGMDVRIVRIFNTYGPRQRPNDGRVISNFVVQAINELPIVVYGNGLQTRSFCMIDDLIDALQVVVVHFKIPFQKGVCMGEEAGPRVFYSND